MRPPLLRAIGLRSPRHQVFFVSVIMAEKFHPLPLEVGPLASLPAGADIIFVTEIAGQSTNVLGVLLEASSPVADDEPTEAVLAVTATACPTSSQLFEAGDQAGPLEFGLARVAIAHCRPRPSTMPDQVHRAPLMRTSTGSLRSATSNST